MELILCEKPAVGHDTARLLGIQEKREGYIVCSGGKVVTWAIGHLLQQDPARKL
jgi:DNA topoisomerase III